AFDSSDIITRKATAEDLIRFAKPITTATAKAVAAGNSCRQEDIIGAANMGRKAIFDLLAVTKVRVQSRSKAGPGQGRDANLPDLRWL
ncbi:talin-1-like, partial [Elysia marginata]